MTLTYEDGERKWMCRIEWRWKTEGEAVFIHFFVFFSKDIPRRKGKNGRKQKKHSFDPYVPDKTHTDFYSWCKIRKRYTQI